MTPMKKSMSRSSAKRAPAKETNAFDESCSFCLFRIPRNGGRVIWQVTNQCNYKCSYCIFSADGRKPEGELETPQIMRTLDALKERGFTHLKLTGGEPFVRQDMVEILRRAHELELETDISSNASLITPQLAASIAATGVKCVHVSLDGPTKELQEKVRGPLTFDRTVRGIKNLVAAGVYVRIGCLIYRDNERSLEKMVKYCADLGVAEVIFSYMEPVGRMRGDNSLVASRKMPELIAELSDLRDRFAKQIKVSFSFTREAPAGAGICPGTRRFLSIDNLGRVSPCTWVAERQPDFVCQLSLRDHSLEEILAAPEIRRYAELSARLAASDLDRCPMTAVPEVLQAGQLDALFAGGRLDIPAQPKFGPFGQIYPFATENIAAYLPRLKPAGKRLLTAGGSGDHSLGAAFAGAREVVAFDINELAPLFAALKREALLQLSYAEFRSFLLPDGAKPLDFRTYLKLRPGLPFASRYFFDRAYEAHDRDGAKLRASGLFRTTYETAQQATKNNAYLCSLASFKKAKQAAKRVVLNWISADIRDLAAKTADRGQFDLITLSNIADYAHRLYPDGPYLEKFRDEVVTPLAQRLTPDGQMVLAYIYDLDNQMGSDKRNRLNDPAERRRVFSTVPGFTYEEWRFPSAIAGCSADGLALWRRQ